MIFTPFFQKPLTFNIELIFLQISLVLNFIPMLESQERAFKNKSWFSYYNI